MEVLEVDVKKNDDLKLKKVNEAMKRLFSKKKITLREKILMQEIERMVLDQGHVEINVLQK